MKIKKLLFGAIGLIAAMLFGGWGSADDPGLGQGGGDVPPPGRLWLFPEFTPLNIIALIAGFAAVTLLVLVVVRTVREKKHGGKTDDLQEKESRAQSPAQDKPSTAFSQEAQSPSDPDETVIK